MTPEEAQQFFQRVMGSVAGIYAMAGVALLLGLLGYVVSLVMRGAIIDQASRSAITGGVDWRDGMRAGLSTAPILFLIDLVWLLPGLVLVGGFTACGILAVFGSLIATAGQGREPVLAPFFAAMAGFACTAVCLGLLYAVVQALFAPMMYQHAVQRRSGVVAAIQAGWRVAAANLGPMLILLVVSILLSVALGAAASVFRFGLSGLGWVFMFRSTSGILPGLMRLGTLLLAAWVYIVLYTLLGGFVEAVRLAIYARAYMALTGSAPGAAVMSIGADG